MNESEYISLRQASKQFGPSISSLRSRIRRGDLPALRFSPRGKIYLRPEDVRRLAIAIAPEPPMNQQELRDLIDQIAKRVLGNDWERQRKQSRNKRTNMHGHSQ